MKLRITREWLAAQLAKLDAAGLSEIPDIGMPLPADSGLLFPSRVALMPPVTPPCLERTR